MALSASTQGPPVIARPDAFSKRGVLGLVVFGVIAFVALLYFIGAGQMGGAENNGRAHAASKGLTGYAGLVQLLEARGDEVSVSRSEADLNDPALLVLTPPIFASAEEIADLLVKRQGQGPTLIVMPKWFAAPSDADDAKPGWVSTPNANGAFWQPEMAGVEAEIDMDSSDEPVLRRWSGETGRSGTLPASTAIQYVSNDGENAAINPLVTSEDRILAGLTQRSFRDDPEDYTGTVIDPPMGTPSEYDAVATPDYEQSDMPVTTPADNAFEADYMLYGKAQEQAWRVMLVAEPDLMNNWGLADQDRAAMALELIDTARGDADLPIVFDLTTNGLGQSRNLLTLAFQPPFLAATLCLLMALLLVGWRAFKRFGPALAQDQALQFGKSQLVENGASVIQRTGRMHLLTGPYARLMEGRLAGKLGLRNPSRDALDAALERRQLDSASPQLAALEQAAKAKDIIRAARALYSLERNLIR